jgi:CRISPR-associated endonuclease Cas2
MAKAQWHLFAYDITHQKRLQKMGKLMKKHGIPLQKSVYFVLANTQQMNELLVKAEKIICLKEDDIRVYPIDDIASVWLYGAASTEDLKTPKESITPWQRMQLWIAHKTHGQTRKLPKFFNQFPTLK